MAVNMPDGEFGYAGVQETQPPGQVPTGSPLTPTIRMPGGCIFVFTPGVGLKVLKLEDIFILGSSSNDSPRIVSGIMADNMPDGEIGHAGGIMAVNMPDGEFRHADGIMADNMPDGEFGLAGDADNNLCAHCGLPTSK